MSKVGGITCQLLKGTEKCRCIISLTSLKIRLVNRANGDRFCIDNIQILGIYVTSKNVNIIRIKPNLSE